MDLKLLAALFILMSTSVFSQIDLSKEYPIPDSLKITTLKFKSTAPFYTPSQSTFNLGNPQLTSLKFPDNLLKSNHLGLGFFTNLDDAIRMKTFVKHLFILDLKAEDYDKFNKALSSFVNLEELEVHAAGDFELPESISQNKALTSIKITASKMHQLPNAIISLKNLEVLKICNSPELTELPANFQALSKLNTLQLSCGIESIDSSIFQLENLKFLNLSKSEITEIPKALYKMKNLEGLNLNYTAITQIPSEITALEKLKILNLFGAPIELIPTTLYQCRNLEVITIDTPQTTLMSQTLKRIQRKSRQRVYVSHSETFQPPMQRGYYRGNSNDIFYHDYQQRQRDQQAWRQQQHYQYIQRTHP